MPIWLALAFVLALQGQIDPCATGESPCDPDRPWARGVIEKYCAASPEALEKLKQDRPGATILACACEHSCDHMDPNAERTKGRKWDARCEARCSPSNCKCPNVCDS